MILMNNKRGKINNRYIKELKIKGIEPLPAQTILDKSGNIVQMHPVVMVPKPRIDLFGIDDTLQAVDLIASIANAVFKVVASGGTVGWFFFVPEGIKILWKVIPAISGIGNVVHELEDLSPEEEKELLDAVKDKLLFKDDVKAIVSMALDILFKIKLLAGVFK